MHHVGEQQHHLLVLRADTGVVDWVSHSCGKTGRSLEARCRTSGTLLWPSSDPPLIPGPSICRGPQRVGRWTLHPEANDAATEKIR
jgi:hypothetical protein